MNYNSLTYLEEKLLHPTRSARFQSARRLRLTHLYALWGQSLSAVALIAWSLLPIFYPGMDGVGSIAFFSVIASVYILAVTLHQQASSYIDRARSLESSARRIDALRKEIQSSILANLDTDADAFRRHSRAYSEILEENPINHDEADHKLASAERGSWEYRKLWALMQLRAGFSLIFCVAAVIVLPWFLLC